MWKTIGCPGYLGQHRDSRFQAWDQTYGKDAWRLVWQVGACPPLSFGEMCMLYEDAYYAFLAQHPEVLKELLTSAENVYDDNPTNIHSGCDYSIQETNRTHVQDIALRRCLVRRGQWFIGIGLLQIRDTLGTHPLSVTLSPGRVPFHRPDLILPRRLTLGEWTEPGSVEEFYQHNRVLQVRK